MTEFYDGRDGWANGDCLYADPTGELWTPKVRDVALPTLRSLHDSSLFLEQVQLKGWRSFMVVLGEWRAWLYLSNDGHPKQAPLSEVESWKDIHLPDLGSSGPIADGLLVDDPEFLEHWQTSYAAKWNSLRTPEWIAQWEATA